MPTWRNQLPPQGKHQGFDLRRTPQNGILLAIVTCSDLMVCDTHYWRGRTQPCERKCNDDGQTVDDSTCPACLEKIGFRSHVYLSVFDPKRSEHYIYECTCNAAKPLQDYYQSTGTLRGCVIHAQRPKGTPNGKVCIDTSAANLSRVNLPSPPDLARALAVIWRLPVTAVETTTEYDYKLSPPGDHCERKTTAHVRADILRNQRTPPDNDGTPPTVGDVIAANGNGHTAKKGRP